MLRAFGELGHLEAVPPSSTAEILLSRFPSSGGGAPGPHPPAHVEEEPRSSHAQMALHEPEVTRPDAGAAQRAATGARHLIFRERG